MEKQLRLLSVIYFFSGLLLMVVERAFAAIFFLPISQGSMLIIRASLQILGLLFIILSHRTFRRAVPTGSNLGCYYLLMIFFLYIWSFLNCFGIMVFAFHWLNKS